MKTKTVPRERTGWRDEEISRRHRLYGVSCPMVDIDFLVSENHYDIPKSIIEYKHHFVTQPPDFQNIQYRTLINLSDRAELPFYAVYYNKNNWNYNIYPGNGIAHKTIPNPIELSEKRYYSFLCYIRGIEPDENTLRMLNESH
tara:strand:- start:34 stop:462 length:429 start_codon:yes stop_codon:yes gene_type:complete